MRSASAASPGRDRDGWHLDPFVRALRVEYRSALITPLALSSPRVSGMNESGPRGRRARGVTPDRVHREAAMSAGAAPSLAHAARPSPAAHRAAARGAGPQPKGVPWSAARCCAMPFSVLVLTLGKPRKRLYSPSWASGRAWPPAPSKPSGWWNCRLTRQTWWSGRNSLKSGCSLTHRDSKRLAEVVEIRVGAIDLDRSQCGPSERVSAVFARGSDAE